MKTLFLTGGTGFVGSHVARLFVESGWHVKALARRLDRLGLLTRRAQVILGEISNAPGYRKHMDGCDAVIHAAGLVHARCLAAYQVVNVAGTQTLANTASDVCPSAMFIHVSSQAAAGPSPNGRPRVERDPPKPVSWYGLSKLQGEHVVERNCRGPWCIVRPTIVYGAGDRGLLEMFTVISRGLAPILSGGKCRVQMLAGEDLARILLAVATRFDLAGRRAFAAGETVSTGDLTRFMAALRSPPARTVPVPGFAVWIAGIVESVREAITGQSAPFNRDKAREILQRDWICDSSAFLGDLGISSLKPWKQGILEACSWYVEHGWLPGCFGAPPKFC